VPLQQVKAKAQQQYAAQIRSLARTAYRKSSQPKACAICGYDVHYEVCHIKPINAFPATEFVAEVNKLSNLVALCPNHHWEFDHNILSFNAILPTVSTEASTMA
jgi:predicted restriction endonuclease